MIFWKFNSEKKMEKRMNSAWAAFGPRPRGRGLAQRPMLAQGANVVVHTERGHHVHTRSRWRGGARGTGSPTD
jgi:hypothetical protein